MRINGETVTLSAPQSVEEMLKAQGYDPQRVAVERNGEIVPRSAFGEVTLMDDDAIEIVAFVGGG